MQNVLHFLLVSGDSGPADFSCCSHICSSLKYLWAVLDSLTCGGDSSMASTDRFLSRSSLCGDAAASRIVLAAMQTAK